MIIKDRYKASQFFLCIVSLFVLGASLYFQYVKGLHPCPLCIMQRFCVTLAVICAIIGVFLNRRAAKIVINLQLIVALMGLYFAGRQLWLQTLPFDQLPACLPGLDVLIRYFPWRDVLQALIWGAADCGEVNWQWMGLSMPAWAAVYFLAMFFAILLIRRLPGSVDIK